MKVNNGGQAFPRTGSGSLDYSAVDGMTLRDYFAAKAMQAIIGHQDLNAIKQKDNAGIINEIFCVSKSSYFYADEMLKAREVK